MKTLDEKVAKKMGWEQIVWNKELGYHPNGSWLTPDETHYVNLPSFSSDWNATKILIKFMRERGYSWNKQDILSMAGHAEWFVWTLTKNPIKAKIIDDDIHYAACEAFMEVELNDND